MGTRRYVILAALAFLFAFSPFATASLSQDLQYTVPILSLDLNAAPTHPAISDAAARDERVQAQSTSIGQVQVNGQVGTKGSMTATALTRMHRVATVHRMLSPLARSLI